MSFDWDMLSKQDLKTLRDIIFRSHTTDLEPPDLTIAPDGKPYLYRWHLMRTPQACSYLHVQVADDPARPLHDHPWDNMSVILSGGYKEQLSLTIGEPQEENTFFFWRKEGDTIYRHAGQAHRLFLPRVHPYTMTLFHTGPKVREWGFWYPDGWRPYTDVTKTENGVSVHIKGGM